MAESIADKFLKEWYVKCQAKKNNSQALSLVQYNEKISFLQAAESTSYTKTTSSEYRDIKKYVLVPGVNGSYKLAKQSKNEEGNFLYVIPNEQLYETISKYHLANGHPGITKMLHYMKLKYSNITQDALTHYVSYCEECNRKKNRASSKSIVVKPIRSNKVHERMQADLTDMQDDPDGDYNWILNMQDHFSKFVHLRPIKAKTAVNVATGILDVFLTTNSAPRVLQCDNGREFDNKLLKQMEKQWPGLKLVHSRLRHPQSQGSVERTNAEVSKHLRAWRRDNGGSSNWAYGLKFVQFQINSTYHSRIEMTPCEAIYGETATVCLATTSLPPENLEVDRVLNEDNVDATYDGTFVSTESAELPSLNDDISTTDSLSLQQEEHDDELTLHLDQSIGNNDWYAGDCWVCSKELESFSISCDTCKKAIHPECTTKSNCHRCCLVEKRTLKRKHVEGAQEKNAKKMLKQSEKHFPRLEVGDNVRVAVPRVDRGSSDPPNSLGVVTDVTEHGSFKIGTKEGQLKGCLARNVVEKLKKKWVYFT